MEDVLYEKYINLQKFIKDYRKYEVEAEFMNKKQFNEAMQFNQYIKINCKDDSKNIVIIMFKDNSGYMESTNKFKNLMYSLGKNNLHVILISKKPLSIYIEKVLPIFKNLTIRNYLHKHFAVEVPRGPLCPRHTILNPEETRKLLDELKIHPLSLPSIKVSDPQCIWIGAKKGQIIKIEALSEISGETIRYRVVTPDSSGLDEI